MNAVQQTNALKQLNKAKEDTRLARIAHEFFEGTSEGRELFKYLELKCGAKFSAFSERDNFNSHSAAYRDGMRAAFLFIPNLINEHNENEQRTDS